MKKSIGILAVFAAAIAALVLAGSAFAQDGGVSVSSGAAAVGESDIVALSVSDMGGEGLGAWTIDIMYDNNLITPTDCSAEQGGVCNENFTDNSVRITGASAGGLEGDLDLGTITFECDGEGESDLTIMVEVFADATVGDPQDLSPSVSNGTFTCGGEPAGEPTALPESGTGFTSGNSSSSLSWFIALFAAIGALGLGASYAVARLRE